MKRIEWNDVRVIIHLILGIGIIALGLSVLFSGCCSVRVKHHSGWPWGPDTYEIVDGKGMSVGYYNGDCCCIAEQVADSAAQMICDGRIDGKLMLNKKTADSVMNALCAKLKSQGIK